jgi:phosphoserine phosphatase
MSAWPLRPQLAPRSRREWARAAERVEFVHLAGELQAGEAGGFTAMMITCGARFYVRRVYERLGQRLGFVVTAVRRQGNLVNPMTAERNHCYVIRLERRQ